jgi:uncharacterized protein YfaT (DUF1175 family)
MWGSRLKANYAFQAIKSSMKAEPGLYAFGGVTAASVAASALHGADQRERRAKHQKAVRRELKKFPEERWGDTRTYEHVRYGSNPAWSHKKTMNWMRQNADHWITSKYR